MGDAVIVRWIQPVQLQTKMSAKRIGDQSDIGVSAIGAMIADGGERKAPTHTLHPKWAAKHPPSGVRTKIPGASNRGIENASRPSGKIPRDQSTHRCVVKYRGEQHTGLEKIRPTHWPELSAKEQQSFGGSTRVLESANPLI